MSKSNSEYVVINRYLDGPLKGEVIALKGAKEPELIWHPDQKAGVDGSMIIYASGMWHPTENKWGTFDMKDPKANMKLVYYLAHAKVHGKIDCSGLPIGTFKTEAWYRLTPGKVDPDTLKQKLIAAEESVMHKKKKSIVGMHSTEIELSDIGVDPLLPKSFINIFDFWEGGAVDGGSQDSKEATDLG